MLDYTHHIVIYSLCLLVDSIAKRCFSWQATQLPAAPVVLAVVLRCVVLTPPVVVVVVVVTGVVPLPATTRMSAQFANSSPQKHRSQPTFSPVPGQPVARNQSPGLKPLSAKTCA